MECYCDCEQAAFSQVKMRNARKPHLCDECGRVIELGERYEHTRSILDGLWCTDRTCRECLELRDYVKAHVPCFCWGHGNMIQDARNALDALADETSDTAGVLFGAGRRLLAIRKTRWRKSA